jgi:hypothetical protein
MIPVASQEKGAVRVRVRGCPFYVARGGNHFVFPGDLWSRGPICRWAQGLFLFGGVCL